MNVTGRKRKTAITQRMEEAEPILFASVILLLCSICFYASFIGGKDFEKSVWDRVLRRNEWLGPDLVIGDGIGGRNLRGSSDDKRKEDYNYPGKR